MDAPLDEAQRLAYLRALGIDLWVPRGQDPAPSALGPAADAPREEAPPRLAAESAASLAPTPPPEPRPERGATGTGAPKPGPRQAPPEPLSPAPPPDLPDLTPGAPSPDGLGWEDLAAAVAGCRACGLWKTRTQTVFGVGNRTADLLVIGEAPGADEDREGEPFVGRAGRLLTQMLAAIGLARDRVYIANILKCRPPGNRDPRPDEVLHCQGFLQRQVALVRPRVILSVGRISAQTLLCTDTPVGRLRGRWLAYGPDEIPLRVTYHPAYLLRSPDQKAKAWEDLTEVARRLTP